MKTVDINGSTYSVGKLNAMQQFHLARRLMPFQAAIAKAVQNGSSGVSNPTDMLAAVGEVASQMSDDDAEHVIFLALSAVSRQDGERTYPVARMGALMYQDMDMSVMLRLVMEVVTENLADFFGQALGSAA